MTFNPNIPDASQSPGLFPAQANTNFSRLQTLVNAEHVFNNTAAANDGVHRQMTLVARANPVALPAGTNGMLYLGTDNKPKGFDGVNNYYLAPVVAAVTFDNTGTVAAGSTNIFQVTRSAAGKFNIRFTNPLPSAFCQIACACNSNNGNTAYLCNISNLTVNNAIVFIQNPMNNFSFVDAQTTTVTFFYGYP